MSFASQGIPTLLTKSGWVDGVNCYIDLVPSEKMGIISFTNKAYIHIDKDLRKIIAMMIAAHTDGQ